MTIIELATKVIELTNSNSRIIKEPLPSDDPKQRKPDIRKANEVLGWIPEVELTEGLKKTIEDFEIRLRSGARNIH
jgi:UDP-glucuronate decarboxylase